MAVDSHSKYGKPGRVSRFVSMEREEIIKGLVLDGFGRREIFQIVNTARSKGGPEFDISQPAVDRYIRIAKKSIQEFSLQDFQKLHTEAVQRAQRLYKQCIAAGDRKTAASVLRELNMLYGLSVHRVMVASPGSGRGGGTIEPGLDMARLIADPDGYQAMKLLEGKVNGSGDVPADTQGAVEDISGGDGGAPGPLVPALPSH